MKFVSFSFQGRNSFGVVKGDLVADLATPETPDLKTFLALSSEKRAQAIATAMPSLQLDQIIYLPVITNPGKIFCVGLNYEEHRQETGRPKAAHPAIFLRFADSQTGHLCPIPLSPVSSSLDYEGELAVVIGKAGRYIPVENALDHVAGYSCYNDGTFRDWQHHTHQFTPGKNFPQSGAFGPLLVTPDEIANFGESKIQTRLNGNVVQSSTLSQMIFSVADIIAYLSGFTQLSVGDVIAAGTPGGVGFKRTPPLFMAEGDTVEVEIDDVGLLRNTIGTPE